MLRTFVVTGAASGIGRAICKESAKLDEAVNLVLADINENGIKEVAEEVKVLGSNPLPITTDVTKEMQVEKMVRETVDSFVNIDVLVNCAGYGEIVPIEEMKPHQWSRMIEAHLYGTFNCIKEVIPVMKKAGKGKIINLSSIYGTKTGAVGWSHYCAAKGGIYGLTLALAKELAPEIQVNAVAPGGIMTPLQRVLSPEEKEQFRQSVPLKRWGNPEEIASFIAYLVSDSLCTGSLFVLDGGLTS
jgi:3-oxoacyl-[acyl-carrier protein] reductase